jgi:uncharacterized protein
MKKFLYLIIILLVCVFLALVIRNSPRAARTAAGPRVVINGINIPVEIADETEEQRQGLSGRGSLDEGSGLLFIFPDKQVRVFWMKDMFFPLDIIWIADNKIIKTDENLPPGGKSPAEKYNSVRPANYVLEVNAGFVARHGLKVGDDIKYYEQ